MWAAILGLCGVTLSLYQVIGSDGVPYTAQSGNGIYGFAKVEDYLAGNADWKAATLLGTDFYD